MTRMISFRVSEQEFELLRDKSEAIGARSVSDYARLILCNSVNAPNIVVEEDVQQLSGNIQQLSLDIRRLTELLEVPRESYNERSMVASSHNGGLGNV